MYIVQKDLLCGIKYLYFFFTVTLLDSMSAPGDLGWEAYPPEGVSTCQTTAIESSRWSDTDWTS